MAQYHIAREGQQLGVHSEQAVRSGLESGQFQSGDLCWTEGMNGWEKLGERFASLTTTAQPTNPYAPPVVTDLKATSTSEHVLASPWVRLGAAFLDGIVALVLIGIPYFFLMNEIGGFDPERMANPDRMENPEFTPTAMIATGVIGVMGLALLVVNLYLLTVRGQTLGKMWLGIRIVTHPDAKNPGFVKAFLLRAFVNGILGAVPCVGSIYSLVDICFIFREDRRCIHDLIAGTQVIVGQPPQA